MFVQSHVSAAIMNNSFPESMFSRAPQSLSWSSCLDPWPTMVAWADSTQFLKAFSASCVSWGLQFDPEERPARKKRRRGSNANRFSIFNPTWLILGTLVKPTALPIVNNDKGSWVMRRELGRQAKKHFVACLGSLALASFRSQQVAAMIEQQ